MNMFYDIHVLRQPIGSMYGIFHYIYHTNQPNVGEYTIHGSLGQCNSETNPIT